MLVSCNQSSALEIEMLAAFRACPLPEWKVFAGQLGRNSGRGCCCNDDLRDDDDIFALGFINSLLAIQLMSFIEKEFSVTIGDEGFDLYNSRTCKPWTT